MTRAVPTGTVTFLFTDIVGSTGLWEQHPEMAGALERHDALLGGAIESNAGHVFKTVGDATCAVFDRPQDAVVAAIEIQSSLEQEPWPQLGGGDRISIRLALHSGSASERDGDFHGPPVNRVARLVSAAWGGQILMSLATQQLLRDRLPSDVELHDWGEHRLKDLEHTERIFQVRGPGLSVITKMPDTAGATATESSTTTSRERSAPQPVSDLETLLGKALKGGVERWRRRRARKA